MTVPIVVVGPDELRELIQEAVSSALASYAQPAEWLDARSAPMGAKAFQRLARREPFRR